MEILYGLRKDSTTEAAKPVLTQQGILRQTSHEKPRLCRMYLLACNYKQPGNLGHEAVRGEELTDATWSQICLSLELDHKYFMINQFESEGRLPLPATFWICSQDGGQQSMKRLHVGYFHTKVQAC